MIKDEYMRQKAVAVLIVIAFSFLTTALIADPTIEVTFPEKGSYIYWLELEDEAGKIKLNAPVHAAGADTNIDLALTAVEGKLPKGTLKIYNPKTGNVAAKNLENLQDKKDLKLKDTDFDLVRTVQVVLKPTSGKENERLESAVVTLTDANSDVFTVLVDPLSEGVAEFHDIAAGAVSVEVQYNGTRRMTVDLEIPTERDEPIYVEEVPVAGKVRTVKVKTAMASSDSAAVSEDGEPAPTKAKKDDQPSFAWLQYIMGLAIIGMIGFIGYVIIKAKGGSFESSLRKLGVQFPQDTADAGTVPAAEPQQHIDPNICQFCGQRKDPVTGNCACSVDAQSSATPASGTIGIPRLIGTQGQYSSRIFEISGDSIIVGRDPDNEIALPEDNTASRRHARIAKENGSFTITDEGSSNGTYVNGMRITGRHQLQPGDEIQIGSTKFRFEV